MHHTVAVLSAMRSLQRSYDAQQSGLQLLVATAGRPAQCVAVNSLSVTLWGTRTRACQWLTAHAESWLAPPALQGEAHAVCAHGDAVRHADGVEAVANHASLNLQARSSSSSSSRWHSTILGT
jgi:hypothetical protein